MNVTIEPIQMHHFEQLYKIVSDPEVMQTIGNKKTWSKEKLESTINYAVADWKKFKNNKQNKNQLTPNHIPYYTWVVKYGKNVVGYMGISLQNNNYYQRIFIDKKYWGLGIAGQALQKLVEFMKKNSVADHLYMEVMPENIRNQKSLEKFGARLTNLPSLHSGNLVYQVEIK